MTLQEMLEKLANRTLNESSAVVGDTVVVIDPFYEILFDIPYEKLTRGCNIPKLVPEAHHVRLGRPVGEAVTTQNPNDGKDYIVITVN